MIVIIGTIIVFSSVLGGFIMAGGHPGNLLQIGEFVIIIGAALGALIVMSPKRVLKDIIQNIIQIIKGTPHSKETYIELFKALYELFMVARRNGVIALEDHINAPYSSPIFSKYPLFLQNKEAVEFLCSGLRPIVDGRIKPEQLRLLLETELETIEEEDHAPAYVLTKTADSMPGFGIVAAVLGIVNTMASISGSIETVGHKVAGALVGTFLGVLLCYGLIGPLAVSVEYNSAAKRAYLQCIATAVVAFAGGMAPLMAIEMARRKLAREIKPSADELETILKSISIK